MSAASLKQLQLALRKWQQTTVLVDETIYRILPSMPTPTLMSADETETAGLPVWGTPPKKEERIAHTKTNEHTETHSASRFTVRMFVADASSDSGSLFTGKGG